MTRPRDLLLGTLAYAGVTFPLAFAWHLVIFADLYERVRFVTVPEPNVPLGFFTIVFQGILLAAAYPRFRGAGRPLLEGLRFGLFAGAFIWSAATVAHVAKHDVVEPGTFIGMEAAYFLINFVAYGILMGAVAARGTLLHPARFA
jgi:hypothetical protein